MTPQLQVLTAARKARTEQEVEADFQNRQKATTPRKSGKKGKKNQDDDAEDFFGS